MTAPIEAYVSVAARDAYREMQRRKEEGRAQESDVVAMRVRGVLVVVARGPIAEGLVKAFEESE